VPVIAIGVPIAVETAVIVNESLKLVKEKMQAKKDKDEDFYEQIKDILNPQNYNLIVTPKEIDELVEALSLIISEGINLAL
jgi:spore protease